MSSKKKRMQNKPIYVTRPFLPELGEFTRNLEEVWETGILTHNGPLVQRFEKQFAQALGVDDFVTVTNGTIALQIAIKALNLKGEIITTPFTWIATVSAIEWEGCTPVFCDIEPETLNIDASLIEDLITDKTVAIMPVHVFGNPCAVDEIEQIARKHNLKVIYDAAHAVGSTYNNRSVLECGDVSATSLHGTKIFNTAEGGGLVSTNRNLVEKFKQIRFFGHDENKDVVTDGFNGKMTEIHAALGLASMKNYSDILNERKRLYGEYLKGLKDVEGLKFQANRYGTTNYSYFPVVFENESDLCRVEKALNKQNIIPRRYFYPSLDTLEYLKVSKKCKVSRSIAKRILCLPLFSGLSIESQLLIMDTIKVAIKLP